MKGKSTPDQIIAKVHEADAMLGTWTAIGQSPVTPRINLSRATWNESLTCIRVNADLNGRFHGEAHAAAADFA